MAGVATGEEGAAEMGTFTGNQTALSQGTPVQVRGDRNLAFEGAVALAVGGGGVPGTASPGAMELGLIASPFHSS